MSYEDERQRNREWGTLAEWRITTRVPSKYRLVDLETGDVWAFPDEHGSRRRSAREVINVLRAKGREPTRSDSKTL